MSFLFPTAWALLALGLPIIAFYLIRTRLERRGVSTLLFWEQIKTQSYNSALWRKLRRWLSLSATCVKATLRNIYFRPSSRVKTISTYESNPSPAGSEKTGAYSAVY